jgi:hypothetical protein
MNNFSKVYNAKAEVAIAKSNLYSRKTELFHDEFHNFLLNAQYRKLVWQHAVDLNNGMDVDIWDNDEETLASYFVEYVKYMHNIDLEQQRIDYFELDNMDEEE